MPSTVAILPLVNPSQLAHVKPAFSRDGAGAVDYFYFAFQDQEFPPFFFFDHPFSYRFLTESRRTKFTLTVFFPGL